MFIVKDISLDNNTLFVKFSSKKALNNLKLEFRFKDMTRYAVSAYNQYFETNVVSKEESHEIKVDIEKFMEQLSLPNLSKQIVWMYINNNGQFQPLKLGKDIIEKIKKMTSVDFGFLADLKLMNNKNNTLGLTISKKNISCNLNKVSLKEHQLKLELLPIQKGEKTIELSNLHLKKRVFKDTQVYTQSVLLKDISKNVYQLDLSELTTLDYDKVNNLDFIVEIKDKKVTVEIPIHIKDPIKLPVYKGNNKLITKLYSSAKKTLCFRVVKEDRTIEVTSCETIDQVMTINFNLKGIDVTNLESLKCGIFRYNSFLNDPEFYFYSNIELTIDGTNAILQLNIIDLFSKLDSNYTQQFVVALYVAKSSMDVLIHLAAPNIIQHKISSKKSTIAFSIQNMARFDVYPNNCTPINISILGSCFSRAAFNSSNDFFNLDYKYYFNLKYSHFWISLISAVSEKIPYDATDYEDVPAKVINNIAKEYKKTTFSDLKKSNSDYVIIDLFVDAVHGVRKFSDGKFISQNGDLHNSYYYKNHFLKETSQFDMRHPEFWNTWKKSCDLFIERVEQVIGKNKIILNLGGLSDGYYKEDREISSFSIEKKFSLAEINFINHTWEKMNNYFLSRVPDARIIDLSQYNYLASLDYPYGGSGPHHYERNYYKTFLGELAKIALLDKTKS